MNKSTFLFLLFCTGLSSCGIFSKYHNGQHRYFNQAISKEEKAKLKSGETITKQWQGTNNLDDSLVGTLLIYPIVSNYFEFMEQGTWKHNYAVTRSGRKDKLYRDELTYDSLGNLIAKVSYCKLKKAQTFHLAERMSSEVGGTGDQKFLLQTYNGFYETGEMKYKITLRSLDYDWPANEEKKRKEIEIPIKYFNKSGAEISELPSEGYDGLIKFTKMKNK